MHSGMTRHLDACRGTSLPEVIMALALAAIVALGTFAAQTHAFRLLRVSLEYRHAARLADGVAEALRSGLPRGCGVARMGEARQIVIGRWGSRYHPARKAYRLDRSVMDRGIDAGVARRLALSWRSFVHQDWHRKVGVGALVHISFFALPIGGAIHHGTIRQSIRGSDSGPIYRGLASRDVAGGSERPDKRESADGCARTYAR
jgi:hypothetical protein